MSVAICIDKVIVMFPSVLNHTTGIQPFLTKDHVSPVHCFVILSAQKKRQEKWCNNALTRNGTLRELVAHQYSFSGLNKTCSKEKLLLSSIDVKIHIILILFIPNSYVFSCWPYKRCLKRHAPKIHIIYIWTHYIKLKV